MTGYLAAGTRRAHLAMLLFAFLVSTSFTVGHVITDGLDPAVLTLLRFSMAAVIIAALMRAGGHKAGRPGLRDIRSYVFLAFLLVVFFVTMFESLRWTDSLSSGAVFTLCPLITAVISLLVLGQILNLAQVAALVIAGAGAVWVMFDGDVEKLAAFRIGWGELIFLVGVTTYAAYPASVRMLHTGVDLLVLTFWTLVAGIVLLVIWTWPTLITMDFHAVPVKVYAGIAYLAVFTTTVTFYLIQYASLHLPSAKVMAYTYLIPAFVLVQNVIAGAPWPGTSVLLGVAVITVATMILQKSEDHEGTPPAGRITGVRGPQAR